MPKNTYIGTVFSYNTMLKICIKNRYISTIMNILVIKKEHHKHLNVKINMV